MNVNSIITTGSTIGIIIIILSKLVGLLSIAVMVSIISISHSLSDIKRILQKHFIINDIPKIKPGKESQAEVEKLLKIVEE